jgi:hypothetical protein
MKKIYTAMSTSSIREAIDDLYIGLNKDGAVSSGAIKLIMFFVSSSYNVYEVNALMKKRFSGIQKIGCTTAGELYSGHLGSNGIVAMGLTGEIIEDMHIEVVEHLDESVPDFKPIIDRLNNHFGLDSVLNNNDAPYFGILLLDGLCMREELFLEAFGDFTNIKFTGGSAGDDMKFIGTALFANDRVYEHSGLICVIKTSGMVGVERTQNFKRIGKVLRVTRADEKHRIIYELDGRPANDAYCEAVGISKEKLSNKLVMYPLGLMLDTPEPFVRSVAKVNEDGSFTMYCAVKENMDLEILESINLIKNTQDFLSHIQNKYSEINGMLVFNCVLRYSESRMMGNEREYGDLFKDVPTIGFCTYGEYYIGFVNQTLTVLVL